ncbi:MAG: Rieske 2Fe-2S domain-containing protein [Alphaproteobacteria bacterium]|nr:Rieske 2Fe-2S domain-containing protein [Alphaproteobacteria bacterium]
MEPDWIRSVVDADAFEHEQRCLSHVWTFLGLTVDVANDGDWLTASIATRSVFVQRFGGELRGFENLCAHRFYPLRNGARGNGRLICEFHHWQYDSEGRAVAIPHARELFDAVPAELCARLNRVEIATCGTLIFGRFAAPGVDLSLEDFLGEGLPFLHAASQIKARPQYLNRTVAANWRLCMHVTLDDYHVPAVHPTSMGRSAYVQRQNITYKAFGLHSSLLSTARTGAFERLLEGCRKGTYRPTHYVIFQITPNLTVLLIRVDFSFFYGVIVVYDALRHDRTNQRAWLFPAPFVGPYQWLRKLTDPVRKPIVRRLAQRILCEDNRVCERLQETARQMRSAPRLGRLEERIDWFENSYRQLIAEGEARMRSAEER